MAAASANKWKRCYNPLQNIQQPERKQQSSCSGGCISFPSSFNKSSSLQMALATERYWWANLAGKSGGEFWQGFCVVGKSGGDSVWRANLVWILCGGQIWRGFCVAGKSGKGFWWGFCVAGDFYFL
jgi:hypothetical protein